jgi:dienelactone hydrolase
MLSLRLLICIACGLISVAFRLSGAEAPTGTPASATSPANPAIFDYDHDRSFDIQDVETTTRDDARIRDLTFIGAESRIKAYLVTPVAAGDSLAAILYVHWLGERATTNRTEFLNEAVALASQGVVSLLVDAMWAQPKWYDQRMPEEDYQHSIQQVIDLRRSIDLLLAQPGVEASRLAYVGHDFGAMYGIVMGSVDHRPTTYVLMAGAPHFADWYLFGRQPKSPEEYRRQLAPLDPVQRVSQLAPAPVFFQFAAHDQYVSADAAAALYAAALPRKQTAMYDATHSLQKPEVTADRINWLVRALAKK